ncbi:MAG: hypothetical protein ACYCUM_04620 [Solirubrobacteraceae bacterium]
MASELNIPTPWIGTEDLPVHFANAFGVGTGEHAIFLLAGSVVPISAEDGGAPPFVPVKPIVRMAIAPQAVPQLIEALENAHRSYREQGDQ